MDRLHGAFTPHVRPQRGSLLKLGARPADIGQTGEEQWHVLTDPEGNEFCLLKARLDPL
ncbi:VOC family protein [Micromonospora coerulea]|uniref:VOC family protein n=1 Tax=Micromonospora coerulea TaxID=47856 RepID=UPI0031F8BED9